MLATLACCATTIQRPLLELPARLERLQSGLQFVTEIDEGSAVVAVVSVVDAGSAHDPEGLEGLAHLVEHLTFRARGAGGPDRSARVEAVGGRCYGTTDPDTVTFGGRVPQEHAEELFAVEADRLAAPLAGIDQEIFEAERQVVLNEMRMPAESRYVGEAFGWLQSSVFEPPHLYSRPGIGTEAALMRATLADAQAFAARFYRPDRATLYVAGPRRAVRRASVSALPSALRARPVVRADRQSPTPLRVAGPPRDAPPVTQERVARVRSPEVWYGWRLPAATTVGERAKQEIIGGFIREQLTSDGFLEGDSAIRDVDLFLAPGSAGGLLAVRVALREGADMRRAFQDVSDRIAALWGSGPSAAARFKLVRERVLLSARSSLEGVRDRAVPAAQWAHVTREADAYARTMQKLDEHMRGWDVRGTLESSLSPQRARVMFLRPGDGLRPPGSAVGEGVPPSGRVSDRPTPPSGPRRLLSGDPTTAMLPNGMEVIVVRRPGFPVVVNELVFRGGFASRSPGTVDAAAHATKSVASGLRAAAMWSRTGPDRTSIVVRAGAAHLEDALAMLAHEARTNGDTLTSFGPQWPSEQFQKRVRPALLARERDPTVIAVRAFQRALHDSHPYGRFASVAEMEAVDAGAVSRWLAAVRRPDNATLIVVGDVDPARALEVVSEEFGDWARPPGPTDVRPPPPRPLRPASSGWVTKEPRFVAAATGPHTRVLYGCRLKASRPEEAARASLLAELFRGEAFPGIRRRNGHGDDVAVTTEFWDGGIATITLSTHLDHAAAAETMAHVRSLWDVWADSGLPSDRVHRARAIQAVAPLVDSDTSADLAFALSSARAVGWSWQLFDRWPALVAGVTPDQLQAAAAECRANAVMFLVGDLVRLRAAGAPSASASTGRAGT